jgi:hypothetical protein
VKSTKSSTANSAAAAVDADSADAEADEEADAAADAGAGDARGGALCRDCLMIRKISSTAWSTCESQKSSTQNHHRGQTNHHIALHSADVQHNAAAFLRALHDKQRFQQVLMNTSTAPRCLLESAVQCV